jgi:hypothetical protein
MTEYTFSNGILRLIVATTDGSDTEYYIVRVEWSQNGVWRELVAGDAGKEFVTSMG